VREDVGEVPGKRAASHDLVAASLPGGLDRRCVDVRDEADGADTREFGIRVEGRQRVDRVGLRTVEIEDDQRRLELPRLRDDRVRRASEGEIDS
jgi:hypothetical protein